MNPETVISDPIDVRSRVAELGLSVEVLTESILAGELARNSCTPNDPPSAPGFLFWAKIVRALRENLVTDGFVRSDERNFSIVVSPDRSYSIAVSTGDEATGDPSSPSSTKYAKGPLTVEAVERNGQLLLFKEMEPPEAEDSKVVGITRILLVRKSGDSILSELSVPDKVVDGFVETWAERIILPTIELDRPERRANPEDDADDLDIDITRRNGQ
jgi:hypothetical protein